MLTLRQGDWLSYWLLDILGIINISILISVVKDSMMEDLDFYFSIFWGSKGHIN